MIVFQLGGLITGEAVFGIGTVVAVVLLAGIVYLLVRRGYRPEEASHPLASAAAVRS